MTDFTASNLALFRFTLSHLPNGKAKTTPATAKWRDFKTFGFFDQLLVSEETPHTPPVDPDNVDRYKRTFFGWGDQAAVWRMLGRAKESDGTNRKSGYLGVCLIKLTPAFGHANYYDFYKILLGAATDRVSYLVCLDAPDVIVLSTFGDQDDPEQTRPLARLLDWSEQLRDREPLKGQVERLLTMVACHDAPHFITTLAGRDPDSQGAGALVRITDMDDGKALPDLLARIDPKVWARLRTTVGYYDIQAELTVPEAAHILERAGPLVGNRLLTTSTCFTSPTIPGKLAVPPRRRRPVALFLTQLKKFRPAFDEVCEGLAEHKCLNPNLRELVIETTARFERLHTTGLIPGSRLLIWTAHDAVQSLIEEGRSYLRARPALQAVPADLRAYDDAIHQRQRDYAQFLRAICDELDHRIALSLAAHTRFFPCSIEVPLKMVGALDMASRLIAASFRSYRCRRKHGLLQVFIAKAVKPSEFFRLVPKRVAPDNEEPFPTLVLTMFSPQLVRHFYYGLFLVLYEVAQCIIAELMEWPSFTSLVFAHAFSERVAVISTLAEGAAPRQLSTTRRARANEFLTAEFMADDQWQDTRIGPGYFMADEQEPSAKLPLDWETIDVWAAGAGHWRLEPLDPGARDSAVTANHYCRDARLLQLGVAGLRDSSFRRNWARHVLLRRPAPPPPEPDTLPEDPEKSCAADIADWSDMGVNFWNEYLELASLIPFLRLFEQDPEGHLFRVVSALVRDQWDVWRDSEDPAASYDGARRYVVCGQFVNGGRACFAHATFQ